MSDGYPGYSGSSRGQSALSGVSCAVDVPQPRFPSSAFIARISSTMRRCRIGWKRVFPGVSTCSGLGWELKTAPVRLKDRDPPERLDRCGCRCPVVSRLLQRRRPRSASSRTGTKSSGTGNKISPQSRYGDLPSRSNFLQVLSAQAVNATLALKRSAGVSNSSVLRGLSFRRRAAWSRACWECSDKSVPLGK